MDKEGKWIFIKKQSQCMKLSLFVVSKYVVWVCCESQPTSNGSRRMPILHICEFSSLCQLRRSLQVSSCIFQYATGKVKLGRFERSNLYYFRIQKVLRKRTARFKSVGLSLIILCKNHFSFRSELAKSKKSNVRLQTTSGRYRTSQAIRTEFIEEFVLPDWTCSMCAKSSMNSARIA